MSSHNPGISAAGEAAGRTALNPSAGRAAIGGMLSSNGEPDFDPALQAALQARLRSAVSDIIKLANAMGALSTPRMLEGDISEERRSGVAAHGG